MMVMMMMMSLVHPTATSLDHADGMGTGDEELAQDERTKRAESPKSFFWFYEILQILRKHKEFRMKPQASNMQFMVREN